MGGSILKKKKKGKKNPKPIFFTPRRRRPPENFSLLCTQPPGGLYFADPDGSTIFLPLSAAPPLFETKPEQPFCSHSIFLPKPQPKPIPSQPWLLPHFILIYNLQPGSPWFPFPFDPKTISRNLPSHQQRDTTSRPKRKANLSSSQRRTDPHFGSGHLPFGYSHSRLNRPAPLCTQTFFSSPSAKNITSQSPHNPSSPVPLLPSQSLICLGQKLRGSGSIFLPTRSRSSPFSLHLCISSLSPWLLPLQPSPNAIFLHQNSRPNSLHRQQQHNSPISPQPAGLSRFLHWSFSGHRPTVFTVGRSGDRTPAAAPSFFPLSADPATARSTTGQLPPKHQICHRQKEQPPERGSRLQIQSWKELIGGNRSKKQNN